MQPIDHVTKVKVGHGTHEGMTGKHNEDSYGFFAWQIDDQRDLHLAIVADGIGGQAAGERASSLAVATIRDFFSAQKDVKELPAKMAESIRLANDAIVEASAEDPTLRGMGTTIVMTALVDDKLYTAYVGDSRIYLLRGGRLQQLTVDHTWAQEAIEAGLLTRQEAKTHPNRNVIKRYLGNAAGVEIDHRLVLGPSQVGNETIRNQGVGLRPGDVLVLCSDGLSDMISDESIQASLESRQSLQTAVDEMIDKANEAGGKDNITLITVGIPAADGSVPITKSLPAVPAAAAPLSETRKVKAVPITVHPRSTPPTRAWPWMLIAGVLGGILLLFMVAVGAYFIFDLGDGSDENNSGPIAAPTTTPSATSANMTQDELDQAATASLRDVQDTDDSETLPSDGDDDSEATPGLVPTLQSTLTATPRPVIIPTDTVTPEPDDDGSNNGGSPPLATNTRPPPPPPSVTPPGNLGGGNDDDKEGP